LHPDLQGAAMLDPVTIHILGLVLALLAVLAIVLPGAA
jgi:hypothetical protein